MPLTGKDIVNILQLDELARETITDQRYSGACLEAIKRLLEYDELKNQKQLPFKAGDTVWYVDKFGSVIECKIVRMAFTDDMRVCTYYQSSNGHYGFNGYMEDFSELGRSVFLTEEEACREGVQHEYSA